jgi:hypothetical protein
MYHRNLDARKEPLMYFSVSPPSMERPDVSVTELKASKQIF